MSTPVAVLISGSGTNLQALLDDCDCQSSLAHIAVVISNRRDAYGLERARQRGIPAIWVPHRKKSREDFEADILDVLQQYKVEWVVLAGFMRVLTAKFLSAYHQRVLNIHPSLLPAFPGINAQQQALDYPVKITGATVHFVDTGMDTGPIIIQESVPVYTDDDISSLKTRILAVEHKILPQALQLAVAGRLLIEGRTVQVLD